MDISVIATIAFGKKCKLSCLNLFLKIVVVDILEKISEKLSLVDDFFSKLAD